ncbi:hypothetical protein ACFVGY_15870 [Streptomyces sp. NPDC127106]|uniref:hypothetical protein n=1 Tax=Streptomyces sp. NPDC127106 TaxID=3345360 RepID=UPI00362A5DF2
MNEARSPQIITRLVDGRICAYDLASEPLGVLEPTAVFRPSAGDEPVGAAVSADLRRAVYTTLNAVVCVSAAGEALWRSALEPHSDQPHGHWPGCVLSLDGRAVWVYRPDAMAGRDGPDQWVALDAGTGAVVARTDLDTVGHGGGQFLHPQDGSVLLDVGEGQDGSVIHRAAPGEDGAPVVTAYPWWDRCLISLAPGGEQFMTVHHEQRDVAFHRYPDGEVLFALSVEAFGHDPGAAYVEWSGGYLMPDTAVVTVAGENEDGEEWFRCHLVDVRTGAVAGEFTAHALHADEVQPLGDGSWLTSDPFGHPVRRRG